MSSFYSPSVNLESYLKSEERENRSVDAKIGSLNPRVTTPSELTFSIYNYNISNSDPVSASMFSVMGGRSTRTTTHFST